MTQEPPPPPDSLEEAIARAGSPMHLLWKPGVPPWSVPVVPPEHAGWAVEQAAWREGVVLKELSHHMWDLFIEGPDALDLLRHVSANDYDHFAIGQAKQFIPVTPRGHLVTDGILMRSGEQSFILSGVPAAQTWVRYHAARSGAAVTLESDPDSSVRRDRPPRLFRLQIQGPRALEVVARAFGGPLPAMRFFHSVEVELAGHRLRAFRHGMAGQAGYEFIGDWAGHDAVEQALLEAGEPSGLIRVGGKAYFTNGIESGWIPTPTPGIYTDPDLADYRRFIPFMSFEAQRGLSGSFFSPDIEAYYCTPWELGYGRSIAFNHDFIGREALEAARDRTRRQRMTLVFDPEDVRRVFGSLSDYRLSYQRHRIEAGGRLVGMTFYSAIIAPVGTMLSLVLIDRDHAEPGRQVEVVWGDHPGPGTDPEADPGLARIRARVAPSPFDAYAREKYRAD